MKTCVELRLAYNAETGDLWRTDSEGNALALRLQGELYGERGKDAGRTLIEEVFAWIDR